MLISEYLQMRNISVTTGNAVQPLPKQNSQTNPKDSPFAKELQAQLEKREGVEFSRHALDRIQSRQIDMTADNKLERLNRAVEIAQEKGSRDALVLLDTTAFLVSVKNNKVITTMTAEDMQGNIFTNIDSTVIM